MCVFSDRPIIADVGAGADLRGYRVFDVDALVPGRFVSPLRNGAVWDARQLASGEWFIDGPTLARGIDYRHDPRNHAEGFYVVDSPRAAQGAGVLLAVRPAGTCARHEAPGGWRASSLVVEGAAEVVPPAWLAEEEERARREGRTGLADRLEGAARPVVRNAPAEVPSWLPVVEVVDDRAVVPALESYLRTFEPFAAAAGGYYSRWSVVDPTVDVRTLVLVPDELAPAVDAYLGRVHPDAPTPLSYVVAEVAGERVGREARLVLSSKYARDLAQYEPVARIMLERVGRPALLPTVVDPGEDWLMEVCREAERRWNKRTRAATKARRAAERFENELERRLRRDPLSVVEWLRGQPADVRKREGIRRSADAQCVSVVHRGERWSVTTFAPDVVRLELVARGSYVNVYARWVGGKWHPAGVAFSDASSGGWSGMHYATNRANALADMLGQKWELVHLMHEETGGRYHVDNRAHLPASTVRRIERERQLARERVRKIAGA